MASITYGGKLLMKPEKTNINLKDDYMDDYTSYPFNEPKVYLDGACETYHPQLSFSWSDDSVVLVRDTSVVEYTKSSFTELLAKDKDGNIIWVDGRRAPYSNCWNGEYLGETRAGQEFSVTFYDIKTLQKKRYKMVLDETTEFESWDYRRLANFVDADTLDSHLIIKDGILKQYFGSNKNLVIPDSVTKIDLEQFADQQQLESITIPKTLIYFPSNIPKFWKANRVEVDEANPKYYSKNGCLIDKETDTLVWCYSGNVIPNDISIKKIGTNAFMNREDISSIVIPDGIEEIEDGAFKNCITLEKIIIPKSVIKIGLGAFYNCKKLIEIKLPPSLTVINSFVFGSCSNLLSVHIPDSLTTIESGAFAECNKLKEIELPEDCLEEAKHTYGRQLIKENNEWSVNKQKAPTFTYFLFN